MNLCYAHFNGVKLLETKTVLKLLNSISLKIFGKLSDLTKKSAKRSEITYFQDKAKQLIKYLTT